jgi:methanogenic corrinoid protein MtbC1
LQIVGEKFGRLETFLPELMVAAETARAVTEQVLSPIFREAGSGALAKRGKIVVGSVKEDVRGIGKNVVALMLGVYAFEVVDRGVDLPTREFLDRVIEVEAERVGLSSLMVTSMQCTKGIVDMRDGLGHGDRFSVFWEKPQSRQGSPRESEQTHLGETHWRLQVCALA